MFKRKTLILICRILAIVLAFIMVVLLLAAMA